MTKKPVLKGRLKGNQLRKLSSLLNMLYSPSELANQIGFTRRQVYRAYIPLGCPHERDETNHIWINGVAFRKWYEKTYKKVKLEDNEAYCVSCKNVVDIQIFEEKQSGRYRYQQFFCPNCGGTICKSVRRSEND